MLALSLEEFMIELKEGAVKNVGPTNKAATAKLFSVTDATAREFGDRRVKLVFTDDEGNEVQVALFPAEAESIAADLETLEATSPVFEDD